MRLQSPSRRHGYTLTELLLAVVIVLGLVGAVVFNFSTVSRTAGLDEGVTQVEALFRFARAHAASSGKQVRILFPEAESGDNAELLAAEAPGKTLRVTSELDPVGAPGVFTDLPEAANFIASISDLVTIQQVQVGEPTTANSGGTESPATEPATETPRNAFSTVTFYPDGTGDSIELLLLSRSEDDTRRFTLRVSGLTGTIRRQLVGDSTNTETAPPAPATEAAAEVAR
ncbi:MAG: Tfp pilus assembly protein FimT/FimU [Limisphaerales bacterium]